MSNILKIQQKVRFSPIFALYHQLFKVYMRHMIFPNFALRIALMNISEFAHKNISLNQLKQFTFKNSTKSTILINFWSFSLAFEGPICYIIQSNLPRLIPHTNILELPHEKISLIYSKQFTFKNSIKRRIVINFLSFFMHL